MELSWWIGADFLFEAAMITGVSSDSSACPDPSVKLPM